MAQRWWTYKVNGPQEGADAMLAFDAFPLDLVVGMGVAAKGYEGDSELFYVFVNADDPEPAEVEQIEAVLGRFGSPTGLSFEDLMAAPQPHFVASGVTDQILMALSAQFGVKPTDRRSN